jgi:hypothetical protein
MSDNPVPEALLEQKYPAKDHVRKVAKWLKENGGDAKGVIYLEGQKDKLIEVGPTMPRLLKPHLFKVIEAFEMLTRSNRTTIKWFLFGA